MAGWKKDDSGNIEMDDHGNPIYVHDDGKEVGWNVPGQLNSTKELVEQRKALKAERDELARQFEAVRAAVGDDALADPETLRKAMATMHDVETGKLLDSGKKSEAVQKALGDAQKEWEARLKSVESAKVEAEKAAAERRKQVEDLVKEQYFSRSAFLMDKNKTTMPVDIAAMLFGPKFEIEEGPDGKPVPVPYHDGEKLYSLDPEYAGKVAPFDEAIERFFKQYPNKDRFLPNLPGGPAASGGMGGGSRDVVLSGAARKDPAAYQAAKAQVAKSGGKVVFRP